MDPWWVTVLVAACPVLVAFASERRARWLYLIEKLRQERRRKNE
jgi:hypothetical protein